MSMLPTASQTPVYQPGNRDAQAIRPDAVIGPDNQVSTDDPAWKALDPCPVCGYRPHDAPEGTHFSGDPHYVFEHCWKCGYRPALNNAVSRDEMQRQFERFQEFIRQGVGTHPTLEAPSSPDVIAQMQAQMAEMQQELARYRAAPVDTTAAAPFTPATQPDIPDPSPIQQPGSIQQPGPISSEGENQGGNG